MGVPRDAPAGDPWGFTFWSGCFVSTEMGQDQFVSLGADLAVMAVGPILAVPGKEAGRLLLLTHTARTQLVVTGPGHPSHQQKSMKAHQIAMVIQATLAELS